MHIGFDISQTGAGKAGCGYYAHAVIGAMLDLAPEHRYSLYPSFGDFYFDPLMPLRNPYPGRNVHYGPRHLSRESAAAFWNAPDVESRLDAPDVVHANNFWCPTRLATSRLLYTCYDLGFMVDPGWTTEANRVGCFEGMFRSAAAADWIVAISEATRAHYLEAFPHFPPERVRVIYPCTRFDVANVRSRMPRGLAEVRGPFWLTVGTIEPRKNQLRLAQAYARYRALGGAAMPLVMAGGQGWLMDDFRKALAAMGIESDVRMTGYVTDEELAWLYRNCYANLYPSLYEGFGLPVLEGLQFGAATLASDSPAIPEVAGDAALLLAPRDVEAWAQAMLRIAREPAIRDALRARAPAQAARFTRDTSASALLALYAEAAGMPRRGESAAAAA
jgi:glycosyltransferase involved in cell wall biosynthesis